MVTRDILTIIPRRAVLAAGLSIILVLVGAAAAALLVLRADALQRESGHLADLAAVMGEQIAQSIQSVDLIAEATVKDLEARVAGQQRLSDAGLLDGMRERVAALAHVRNLLFVDRDGIIRANTLGTGAGALDVSDREYFRVHREGRSETLHVGAPVVSRLTGEPVQVFSRRLNDARGGFQGIVVATMRTSYFENVFDALQMVGADGRIFLFREDGVLLMSQPEAPGESGASFADNAAFAALRSASAGGTLRTAGLLDARVRLIAHRRVPGYPLILAVSVTEDSALASWRRDAWQIGAGAAGAAAFIGLALFLLLRQLGVSAGLQHELLESGERMRSIVQSAMDAVITIDERQEIVLFNATAEKLFRCSAADAVGAPLDRFIPQRFREAHRRHVAEFSRTGVTTRRMGTDLVLAGLRANGEEFPIDASISQVVVSGNKLLTVILRDITERRRAEAAILRERDTAQRYLDIVGVLMVALDSEGKVTLINRMGCELLGYGEAEILGQSWFDRFLPERERESTWQLYRRIMSGETRLTEYYENPVLVRGGAERMIAWHNRPLTDDRGRIVGVLSSGGDVTERRRAEAALQRSYEELRELSAMMNEVREAERMRVARELHDELAQWLTALKMDVSWVASRLPKEQAKLVEKTERMKLVVDATVSSVRRIAADLRPVMLDDLGLIPAVEALLHELSERADLVVSLEADADALDYGEPLATAVYRMVQEALTNVARHAEADEVRVTMGQEGDGLVIRIRDDGKGFDPEAAARRKSYGIIGIRERAQTLGGSARIVRLDRGTLVEITIPVARYRRRGEPRDTGAAG